MKASARIKSYKKALALSGVLLLTTAIAVPVQPAQASFSLFSTPSGKQARGRVPGRRRGGARRGACPATATPLVAIVPATEVKTDTLPEIYVGGATTEEHPTFWFDIPYPLTNDLTAEFVLQNEQGQDIYRTTSANFVDIPTPGIISVTLPSELAPLEIGKTYQWYFKINCGSETPPYVRGGIERVAINPGLASRLATASPLEQATLYQENDIWYDAITAIARLHRAQPDDPAVSAAWTDLLWSLDL